MCTTNNFPDEVTEAEKSFLPKMVHIKSRGAGISGPGSPSPGPSQAFQEESDTSLAIAGVSSYFAHKFILHSSSLKEALALYNILV